MPVHRVVVANAIICLCCDVTRSVAQQVDVLGPAHAQAVIPIRIVLVSPTKPSHALLAVSRKTPDGSFVPTNSIYEGRRLPTHHISSLDSGRFELRIALFADYEETGIGRFVFPEAGVYRLQWQFAGTPGRREERNTRPTSSPTKAPTTAPDFVGSVEHELTVGPAIQHDIDFLNGLKDPAIEGQLALGGRLVGGNERLDRLALFVLRTILEGRGIGIAGREQQDANLGKAVAALATRCPESTYAPYAWAFVATLGLSRTKQRRELSQATVQGRSGREVVGETLEAAGKALQHADPVLRPRALAILGTAHVAAGNLARARRVADELERGDGVLPPSREKPVARFIAALERAEQSRRTSPGVGSDK